MPLKATYRANISPKVNLTDIDEKEKKKKKTPSSRSYLFKKKKKKTH